VISSHPKIFALGTRYTESIFNESVVIEEKVDGSQIGFCKLKGELIIRSKGAIINQENPDKLFKPAVDHILSKIDIIPEGMMFYGETLCKPKHNTLAYHRVPKNHIMLFSVGIYPDIFPADRSLLELWAKKLDIEAVPVLASGRVYSSLVSTLLDQISVLGGCAVEGVVVKNYHRPVALTPDVILPFTCGKLVSEEFKEVHRGRWKDEETSKGKLHSLYMQYQTPARWDKAIIHLKERGELDDSPKDIGKLFKEVHMDIESEEKENIKEALWEMHRKDLLRVATHGLPEYYKNKLMETFVE
jgi:hypothetical protein